VTASQLSTQFQQLTDKSLLQHPETMRLFLILAIFNTAVLAAQFIDIAIPNTTRVNAMSINSKTQVTGSCDSIDGTRHGFLWSFAPNGIKFTVFDPAGSVETNPTSVNDFGIITGYYFGSTKNYRGFVRYPNGTMISFAIGNFSTMPFGINNKGQITGQYQIDDAVHGFIRDPDGTITLFFLVGLDTAIITINDDGIVIGSFLNKTDRREYGFKRFASGDFVFFSYRNADYTYCTAINDQEQVVGYYLNASDNFVPHGYLLHPNGTFVALSYFRASIPWAINSNGMVTGAYQAGNKEHGFIQWSPPRGRIAVFDHPGGDNTITRDINNAGLVIGIYGTTKKPSSFLYLP
jgi:hypothetical protein